MGSDLPYYEHPVTNQQTWTPPDGTDLDALEAYVAAVINRRSMWVPPLDPAAEVGEIESAKGRKRAQWLSM